MLCGGLQDRLKIGRTKVYDRIVLDIIFVLFLIGLVFLAFGAEKKTVAIVIGLSVLACLGLALVPYDASATRGWLIR